jgi:fimbrial chaperone protein
MKRAVRTRRWFRIRNGFVLVLALLGAAEAGASNFNLSPLQVTLSSKAPRALVEIRNQATVPLRLQLTVTAWDQSPAGDMLLTPTEDIILFPSLLTLEPGEMRKVRLGTATSPTASETAYRIFVEELPSQEKQPVQGGQINVLTRLSIPVFVAPVKSMVSAHVQGLTVQNSMISFTVQNTGNVHFAPRTIHVSGRDGAGEAVAIQDVEAWYILAGGSRRFEVTLPSQICESLRLINVETDTAIGVLNAQADVSPKACGH